MSGAGTLQAHTGDTCRIVTHGARWSACPPCNQWIDTRPRCTHGAALTPANRCSCSPSPATR